MKSIKFETIKRNAEREFYNRVGGNTTMISASGDSAPFLALVAAAQIGEPPRKILSDWTEYGCTLIRKWDVRRIGQLIDLFPSCVPTGWRKRRLTAGYDESGDWVVVAD